MESIYRSVEGPVALENTLKGIFKTNYKTAHDRTIDSGRPWNTPKEES